jgi:hypothetical protein
MIVIVVVMVMMMMMKAKDLNHKKCARLIRDILVVQRTQHNHFTTLPKAKSLNSLAQQRHKASKIH